MACANVTAQDAKTTRKNIVYRASLWSPGPDSQRKSVGFIDERPKSAGTTRIGGGEFLTVATECSRAIFGRPGRLLEEGGPGLKDRGAAEALAVAVPSHHLTCAARRRPSYGSRSSPPARPATGSQREKSRPSACPLPPPLPAQPGPIFKCAGESRPGPWLTPSRRFRDSEVMVAVQAVRWMTRRSPSVL